MKKTTGSQKDHVSGGESRAIPPITPIRAGNGRVYLVQNGSRSILVDAGIPGMAERILSAAAKCGLNRTDIALILVTHAHFDHAGSLAALQRETGAVVLAHPFEAAQLRQGSGSFPAGTRPVFSLVSYLGRRFMSRLNRFQPLNDVSEVEGLQALSEYGLDGWILPTPGHTLGSLSLILGDRVAIVGDALFGIFPGRAYPPFANDPRQVLESWGVLLAAGCQTYFPAHGRPVSRAVLQSNLERECRRL
jgi:hydroxyacylglutathione hydrolase